MKRVSLKVRQNTQELILISQRTDLGAYTETDSKDQRLMQNFRSYPLNQQMGYGNDTTQLKGKECYLLLLQGILC